MRLIISGILLLSLISIAESKEYKVTMVLPNTGNPDGCRDTTGSVPINQLHTLEVKAVSLNPAYPDTIYGSQQIYGMEGDTITVPWEFFENIHYPLTFYRVCNPIGCSCWSYHLGAIASTDTIIINPPIPGDTLIGEYYDNIDFTGLYDVVQDSMINFYWNQNPPLPGMGSDNFSVRWTGKLHVTQTGNYKLCPEVCNGDWKFWLAGSLFSEFNAGTSCNEVCKSVGLSVENYYDVLFEYRHTTGAALSRIRWILPNSSSEYIPPSAWR